MALASAFPLLTRPAQRGAASAPAVLSTRLCTITQAGLPQLLAQLHDAFHAPFTLAADGVPCTLSVGPDLHVPVTIVGACDAKSDVEYEGEDNIVVHSPGLAGGFVVSRRELLHCRAHLSPRLPSSVSTEGEDDHRNALGSVSLLQTVNAHFAAERHRPFTTTGTAPRGILDDLYTRMRRRHFSLSGMTQLLHRGSLLHHGALQLDFPYQCGGAQATKRYLDITPEVTDVFGAPMRHGAKVLSRYGVAVSVGVVDGMPRSSSPALLWHPSGAPAACLAPLLHGCQLLPVGAVVLDYNGPVPGSPLTFREDPRRYMKLSAEGCYDDSVWLTEGLFGVTPGSAWPPPARVEAFGGRAGSTASSSCAVVGVGYNEVAGEMELFVRDTSTGEVVAAADV